MTATLFNQTCTPQTGRTAHPGLVPDHRAALERIAPRRTDPALQIYLW